MDAELRSLLDLQESDLKIADLQRQLDGLSPRLRDLEKKKAHKAEALAKAEAAVQVEERRRQDLERRIAQHRQLHDRNTAQLDKVHNAREAGAATTQIEVTKRFIAEDEQEMRATEEQIAAIQLDVERIRGEVEELDHEIEAAHAEVAERRDALEADLATARTEREGKATGVNRALLGKYERIRGRRVHAVHAVRGQSCGHCDTAIPLHRRNQMQRSGGVEVCEACGVMLYVPAGAGA